MSKPIKLETKKGSVFDNQILLTEEEHILLQRVFELSIRIARADEYPSILILRNKLLSK